MSAGKNLQTLIDEYLELRLELTMRYQLALLRSQLEGGTDSDRPEPFVQVQEPAALPAQAPEKPATGKPKPPARQGQQGKGQQPAQTSPPRSLLGGPIADPPQGGQP